jgi:large subunit ribosomal protein L22
MARTEDLKITEIFANEGPRLKRFRARARGRVGKINRRSSHITVVVDEEDL